MCGSDRSSSYYLYDFQKWWALISVEENMKKYFNITNDQDSNYYITSELALKSDSINETQNTLTISIPDMQPCVDGCMGYAYISDTLLQSKGLKRDWTNIHIPIQDLLK